VRIGQKTGTPTPTPKLFGLDVGVFALSRLCMLSIEKCREYLGNLNLTDKEVEAVREALYVLTGAVLDTSFSLSFHSPQEVPNHGTPNRDELCNKKQ